MRGRRDPSLVGPRVMLRALEARDYEAWRDIRVRSRDWLEPWEPLADARPPADGSTRGICRTRPTQRSTTCSGRKFNESPGRRKHRYRLYLVGCDGVVCLTDSRADREDLLEICAFLAKFAVNLGGPPLEMRPRSTEAPLEL